MIIYCENDIYLYNDTGHKFSENSLKRLWFVDYRGPTSSLGKAAAHSDGIYQEAIQAITVLPPRAVFLKSALEEDILCLTKSGIKRCRIMIAGNARNVPWQIPVGGYPLRLIWSARHKRLIVGVLLDLVVDSSSGAKPRDTKKITFSAIKIINPKSESDEDRLTGRRGGNQISIPSSETLPSPAEFAAIIESSVERISSIAEWQLTAGGKLYHMLLVSTFERIRMYNFQTADGPLELKATVSDQAKEPILGVAVYDSTSFITLTRGSLVMYKIDERDGKTNFRQIIRKSLGSVRGSRTVKIRKSQIIIGSSEHGVQIFEYKNISFHHMFSDAIGGHTYDATTMHSTNQGETTHLIIQARHSIQFGQSDSQIIAHFQPSTPTPSNQLTTIFQCTLPTQITCLRQTSLRPSLRPTNHPHNHPRILASAIDGAFYNIDLIPLKTWKLLKLLTNLIEHEQKTLCPFNSSSSSRTVTSRHAGIIPLDEGPESRTVNGDWLSRLLRIRDETPVSFVRRLIAQDHAQVGKRGWVPGLEGIVEQLVIDVVGSDEVVSAGGTVEALVGLVRDVVDGP